MRARLAEYAMRGDWRRPWPEDDGGRGLERDKRMNQRLAVRADENLTRRGERAQPSRRYVTINL